MVAHRSIYIWLTLIGILGGLADQGCAEVEEFGCTFEYENYYVPTDSIYSAVYGKKVQPMQFDNVDTFQSFIDRVRKEYAKLIAELDVNYIPMFYDWFKYVTHKNNSLLAAMKSHKLFNAYVPKFIPKKEEAGMAIELLKRLIQQFPGVASSGYLITCHEKITDADLERFDIILPAVNEFESSVTKVNGKRYRNGKVFTNDQDLVPVKKKSSDDVKESLIRSFHHEEDSLSDGEDSYEKDHHDESSDDEEDDHSSTRHHDASHEEVPATMFGRLSRSATNLYAGVRNKLNIYTGVNDKDISKKEPPRNLFQHNHVAAIVRIRIGTRLGYVLMDPGFGYNSPVVIMEDKKLPHAPVTFLHGKQRIVFQHFGGDYVVGIERGKVLRLWNFMYYVGKPYCSFVETTLKPRLLLTRLLVRSRDVRGRTLGLIGFTPTYDSPWFVLQLGGHIVPPVQKDDIVKEFSFEDVKEMIKSRIYEEVNKVLHEPLEDIIKIAFEMTTPHFADYMWFLSDFVQNQWEGFSYAEKEPMV